MFSKKIKKSVLMFGPVAWLAFAAGIQMLGALLFLKVPLDPILITTYTAIAFGIYLLNKYTDSEDSYNCPEQKMFFQKRSIALPILILVTSTLILGVTHRLLVWHFVLIMCGILYSVHFVPFFSARRLQFVRLKDIIFVKNIAVALLWGITPFAIAAGQPAASISSNIDFLVIVTAFCLTTLINTTSCDVRDIEGDRHTGVNTLATKFGGRTTALFLSGLGLTCSIIIALGFFSGSIKMAATVLFFSALVWTALVAIPIYNKKMMLPKAITEPLIDTQQVFCGIALIVVSVLL